MKPSWRKATLRSRRTLHPTLTPTGSLAVLLLVAGIALAAAIMEGPIAGPGSTGGDPAGIVVRDR